MNWKKISFRRLDWFCHQAPQNLCWILRLKAGANRLEIVMASGRKLDFKLAGGCWVRKQETT